MKSTSGTGTLYIYINICKPDLSTSVPTFRRIQTRAMEYELYIYLRSGKWMQVYSYTNFNIDDIERLPFGMSTVLCHDK